jgi:hypothetical protein
LLRGRFAALFGAAYYASFWNQKPYKTYSCRTCLCSHDCIPRPFPDTTNSPPAPMCCRNRCKQQPSITYEFKKKTHGNPSHLTKYCTLPFTTRLLTIFSTTYSSPSSLDICSRCSANLTTGDQWKYTKVHGVFSSTTNRVARTRLNTPRV